MRVLHVAAEIFPLIKTGGLADVTAALPPALARRGIDVRLLLPGLPAILDGVGKLQPVVSFGPAFGAGAVHLRLGQLPDGGLPAYVIEAPFLYNRPGNPYLAPDGTEWSDNHLRFGLLGWVAAQLGAGALDAGWHPQVVHGHDWHAGLAPAYLAARPGPRPATVFTVHNLAYQGLFAAATYPALGLPPEFFTIDGAEFHGQVSFLKSGLVFADRITTVSPTYAQEIRTPEQACGLGGVITQRSEALSGILNGVDYALWNPMTDPALAHAYDADHLAGKAAGKTALQVELGLESRGDTPLFGLVSRLTEQKGLDLVLGGLPALVGSGAQVAILGSGSADLERACASAAEAHPGSVAVRLGYDEALAHRIIAGADLIAVPSRFEPCGLTQLYGLRYGTLPLVRRVGGLADTVVDATAANLGSDTASGFVFEDASATAFLEAAQRACSAYRKRTLWLQLMRSAMRQNFSWEEAAARYEGLYRELHP